MTKTKCCTLAVLMVLSITTSKAYAFKILSKDGKELRWGESSMDYYIYEEGPKSFTKTGYDKIGEAVTLKEIIDRSFATWKGVANTDIEYKYAGSSEERISGDDGKNVLSFIPSGWSDLEFNPPKSAMAVTITTYDTESGKIVDSDIYFNNDYFTWGHIDSKEEEEGYVVDIQNIATHELGHFLGLDHPSESPVEPVEDFRYATMYYSSFAGDTSRRSLNEDDEHAIQHLYPSKKFTKTVFKPEVSGLSLDKGYNNGSEIGVTVYGKNFGPLTMIKLVGPTRDDTVCKITSYNSYSAECVLDLYYTNRGVYDLVVANTYDIRTVFSGAFSVYGREIEQPSTGGGCGSMNGMNNGFVVSILALIILIFPITFALRKREVLAKVKATKKK